MTTLLVALLLASAPQAENTPVGRSDVGKTAWAATLCVNCHGANGEGAFGPDLAGRGLSWAQFKRAVRKPWGIMPAYNEGQLPDQTLADFYVYLSGLPKVAEPAKPRFVAPPGSPLGQMLAVNSYGCGQCHQPELGNPRRTFGGEGKFDYGMLTKFVYEHTEEFPKGRMGNYSRDRLPEADLQEIGRFISRDLSLRVPVTASLGPGVPSGANTTYTLTLANTGKPSGLTAEDLTISLALPAGIGVVSGTGAGYKGVRPAEPGTSGQAAIWHVRRIAPGERQTYTLTISGMADGLFRGSVVRWTKPEMHRPANLTLRQANIPDTGDGVDVTLPRPPATQ